MKELQFSIEINAPADHVWFVLWDKYAYKKWANVFYEGCFYQGELVEGTEIRFLGPNGDGMHSIVKSVVPNESVLFLHQGDIVNGEKITTPWQNAREHYTLTSNGNTTKITVLHDVIEEYVGYMEEKFPQGLALVKENAENLKIHLEAEIHAPIEKVWECATVPHHIQQWNYASADWHCPQATNDLQVGGDFSYTMAAKDESFSFDLSGKFTQIDAPHTLAYTLADGRKVALLLCQSEGITHVLQHFEPESENALDLQKAGWGNILENLKKHCELG